MTNSNSNPTEPVAVNFVEAELTRAQTGLRRARIFAAASILLVLTYMTFVSVILYTRLLQPKPAAAVATHYVSVFVEENGQALSQQLVEQVPALIAQAPDLVLAQLPAMRSDIEEKIASLLNGYCRELTPQLETTLDEFLVQNQTQVRELIAQTRDPETVHQLGASFEQQVLEFLHAKGPAGVSAMDRLAEGAAALQTAEQQLHRLATAKNLTPEEKQTRRMLGLIMQHANRAQPS